MTLAAQTLALVDELVALLNEFKVPHAVIGATAMAAHGYVRATLDVDLAILCGLATLRDIKLAAERTLGISAEIDEPDADDHLGGVLTCRRVGCLPVQLVNFVNERRARNENPGREAIATKTSISDVAGVVDLAHLVALKLWAGGPKSTSDVIGLMEANPDADLAAIDDVCDRFDLGDDWRALRPRR